MRLEELVNQNYQQLNDNDLYIWKYISSHKKECERLSIEQLAKKTMYHVQRLCVLLKN